MNWHPHVVVASIVERDRRFLIVEEQINGELRLNQPAGHWEQNETLIAAARREALEETRWEVEPVAVLGLYHFDPPDLDYGFLRVAFVSQAVRERPELALDSGILRAVWMTRDEIAATQARHRSPMVLRCVDDYLSGQRFPLDLIAHL